MEAPDEAMETVAGAGGAVYPPEHFDGADGTTTENSKHLRREYDKVVLEALVGGEASAGPAPAEDGYGDTTHSKRTQREEGGDKNPWRASSERAIGQRRDGGEDPPRTVART